MRIIVFGCLALCACTTAEQAISSVQSKYVGRPVDEFFIAKGPPQSAYKLNNGDTIYTWVGGIREYHLPTTTDVQLRQTKTGNISGTATTYGGRDVTIGCTLELHTNANGVVRSARIADDTIGRWQLSRCAEILES
jgi:hypothetical protein